MHNAILAFGRVLDDGVAVVICRLLDAPVAQTFRPARYLLAALDEFPEPGAHLLANVVDTVDLLEHKVIVRVQFVHSRKPLAVTVADVVAVTEVVQL